MYNAKTPGEVNSERFLSTATNRVIAMSDEILTQACLKEILHYDPDTGLFTWTNPRSPRIKPGDPAGCAKYGYIVIKVNNRPYPAAHLAHLYMTGELPSDEMDHINRNPSDNRWKNLRQADRSLNCLNRGCFKNNKAGIQGIYKNRRKKGVMWQVEYRGKYVGFYDSFPAAVAARIFAEFKLSPGPSSTWKLN